MSDRTRVKTILILAANPSNTSRLRLDEEVREIDEGLRRSNKRDQFKLEQKWAVRSRDFYRAILDYQPQIVHFCGHSTGEDGIVLEDEMGQAKLVSADTLAGMFEVFAQNGVECVVLNACFSKVQAEAIIQHVNYAIGMSQALGDRLAIDFAVAFYDALAAGLNVELAFKLGCSQLIGLKENTIPELKKRAVIVPSPSNVIFPQLSPDSSTTESQLRRLRLQVHRAMFRHSQQECYFLNLTNLSLNREIEVTHIWFESEPQIHILNPHRPLPKRLKLDEVWETWIEVEKIPRVNLDNLYNLFRARLSSGQVVASTQNKNVPFQGTVPGGPFR